MLEKSRDLLIRQSFQLAGIKTPETDLTEAELSDAVYILNCMLQSWNNDGFRLFKIKTGYLPLVPGKTDYKFTEDVFKTIDSKSIQSISSIGGTIIELSSLENISIGAKISTQATLTNLTNTVDSFDTELSTITLKEPLLEAVVENSDVFYGDFSSATTPVFHSSAAFDELSFSGYTSAPVIGNTICFQYNNVWQKATISDVDETNLVITINRELPIGDITNSVIIFGTNPNVAQLQQDYPVTLRQVNFNEAISENYTVISLFNSDPHQYVFNIEKNINNGYSVILETAIPSALASQYGVDYVDAYAPRVSKQVLTIADFPSYQTLGYIIRDYARNSTKEACVIELLNESDEITNAKLFARNLGETTWVNIPFQIGTFDYSLQECEDNILILPHLHNVSTFARKINSDNTYSQIGPAIFGGVGKIVKLRDTWYAISADYDNDTLLREFYSTEDFLTFSDIWTGNLMDYSNHAEFQGRMFFGYITTITTVDMKSFSVVPVYAENRCVINDTMINVNYTQLCSLTRDGVNFEQFPFMISNESTWKSEDNLAVISMYDLPAPYQPNCSQIFFANIFGGPYYNKAVVQGLVKKIFFSGTSVFNVSSEEVVEVIIYNGVSLEGETAYLFGDITGRPQEIIDGKKISFDNSMELPMNAISLKDYNLLPQANNNGEPISFCFLRDAEEGQLKVWGSPTKFGEFIKFTYVEPLSLLLGANETPDFPDEYVSSVIDGLAYELGMVYHVPTSRLSILKQNADESKDSSMLHDNEDTHYKITINPRA